MKKLTAGIFSVLMGLVAVNAADAAVASKGYVQGQIKTVSDNISTVSSALETYKTTNDAAVSELTQTVADNKAAAEKAVTDLGTAVDGKLANKQNTLNVTGGVLTWDAATSTLGLTGIATSDNLETLQTTVNTLNGAETEAGSVKKQIADAIAGEVSRADAALALKENVANKQNTLPANWGTLTDEQKAELYPTIPLVENMLADSKTDITAITDDLNDAIEDVSAVADAADALSKSNQSAIADINNADTGILATAKSYSDAQDELQTAAITGAYEGADAALKSELEGKINQASGGASAAVEALSQTVESNKSAAEAAIALKADKTALEGLSQTVETNAQTAATAAKNADDKAVAAQSTADTALANAATAQGEVDALETVVTNNKSATDNALATKIPQPGNECSNPANYCVLTFGTNGYFWEVIERGADEELIQNQPAS